MRLRKTRPGASTFGWVLLIGFVLNFIWEVAQMPLYADGAGQPFALSFPLRMAHCVVPTLGDSVVIGSTYAAGWYVHQRFDWICRLAWRDVGVITLGLVGLALIIELFSVHVLHVWSYTERMPRVPIVDVGLLPTLQLATLTLVTLLAVARLTVRPGARQSGERDSE